MRNLPKVLSVFWAAIFSFASIDAAFCAESVEWRSASASGGGDWAHRLAVTLTNRTEQTRETFLPLLIGNGENQLPLIGERAESLRVFDADGTELLFELQNPDGSTCPRGEITDGAALTIPIRVEGNAARVYYIYYANPKAWQVPDRLSAFIVLSNGDFESGTGAKASGWSFGPLDEKHDVFLTDEAPFSGKKCVKTVVAEGANSTWVAARHPDMMVEPGASYRFTAHVKAEKVTGYCGWYLHIGNVQNSMISAPMAKAGDGTFGWKEVSLDVTVPENADRLSLGTVLYGTGSAWFDAVTLTKISPDTNADAPLQITVSAPESQKSAAPDGLDPNAPELFDPSRFGFAKSARFAVLRVKNQGKAQENAPERTQAETTVFLDAQSLDSRFGANAAERLTILTPAGKKLAITPWCDSALFTTDEITSPVQYFLAVETTPEMMSESAPETVDSNAAGTTADSTADSTANAAGTTAFPGTLAQSESDAQDANNAKNTAKSAANDAIPEALWERNLVKNGALAWGENGLDHWSVNAPDGVTLRKVEQSTTPDGNEFEMTVSSEAGSKWPGARQSVPVRGGESYLCAFRVQNGDDTPPFQLHYHQHKADGSFSSGGMGSVAISKNQKGYQTVSSLINVAPDTELLTLHLTVNCAGTWRFDSLLLTEALSAEAVGFYGGKCGVFQVPSVVKIFPDTMPSASDVLLDAKNPASIFAFRNESETLQIAFRPEKSGLMRLSADAPKLVNAAQMDASQTDASQTNTAKAVAPTIAPPKIEVVGYVQVDYPTNYYQLPDKATFARQLPKGSAGCDGWAGLWPDPLIPLDPHNTAALDSAADAAADAASDAAFDAAFDAAADYANDSARLAAAGKAGLFELSAGVTRALWLTFRVSADAAPGCYAGEIRLENCADQSVQTIPYTLRVFGVTLPDEPVAGAIYDLRNIDKFARPDEPRAETQKRLIEFMAERKLSPDSLPAAPPIVYDEKTGQASCDWTEFDAVASWYFDTLHVRWSYTPNGLFYLFGWGMPPKQIEGENPYEGDYPYAESDHALLRPEYKKAFQAKLACFWNHVQEKGWDRNFVLYISDEPFYSRPEILEQMKALCAMIHEVDPAIPIYSSTWRHVPEWDGALNVWGIGHYGIVPPEQLEKSKKRGDSFWWTTDGQMCLDTPYAAIERLLPWWCVRWGADAYEFWGATWYTYNPFDFGWHRFIPQSDTPTNKYFVRYPNGDGYIIYPGALIGVDAIISSVRCEAARDGQEDALLWARLLEAIDTQSADAASLEKAKKLRDKMFTMVPIPVAGGRYSTRYLSDPKEIDQLRQQAGELLEQIVP